MEVAMKRLIGSFLFISVLLTGAPALAASDWDPDDVNGPLDMRWVAARFVPHDRFKLTVSFYPSFRPSALPRQKSFSRGVAVILTDYLNGLFRHRRDGRIVFVYGDFASSCCSVANVRRPFRDVLRVVFPTVHDPADLTYRVRPTSTWYDHGERVRDRTSWLNLGRPPDA
jgi:hypothetical protein